ncbi:sarcosine oxidase subunit alpha family protein [Aestuariibius sp. HNIBRBA575]|uniref:sarcosine oxidase subunit alpha family protein n=1 Tax=Aestuariibius sp. HNIBRBA575 TaxID=3233343 RepID=UPI0034A48167
MRIPGKGIYSDQSDIRFQFDGRQLTGRTGDTLASALMANDVHLLGRSFKYHRPRGVLTAGSEEPNALMTIGRGAQADPNTRATTQELYEGLEATSQNRWPSLGFDLMSITNLAASFLGAGFYYKTFMWPKSFWEKLYEPVIRRAAGLGALSGLANTDRYEKAYAFCDVLVIGAGPSGLMAAWSAARSGADVILADEDFQMGGRLLSETQEVDGKPSAIWAQDMIIQLSHMDNVRLMPRTTITGVYDQGTFGALEKVGHHHPRQADKSLECFWRIAAKRTVLAAGALERPIAFANNDRPGIMTAGAMRSYLNRWGVVPGQRIAVFGNNDDAHQTAHDLSDAGIDVVALIDPRPDIAASDAFPVLAGGQISSAQGRHKINGIRVCQGAKVTDLQVDGLAVSGGWNPSVHLTCHLNNRPVWNPDLAAFVPRPDTVPGLITCGAANGIMSTAACLKDGVSAAEAICNDLNFKVKNVTIPDAQDDPYRISPLWETVGKGRKWLDFQNDVTTKDVRQAAQENMRSVEHMKRYTTQGMATDQGKNSNVVALAILADATGRGIPETGTTTFRPPYTPVSIGAMGAGAQGQGFAPHRLLTSHAMSKKLGAPQIEAGLWHRASYYPIHGETHWRQSCDREVKMVREHVGICDVSTLGKIDVQGPDAAAFLDFAYANTFSTLKPGRVRYGIMLREDGHVMDDGTTACLAPDHYVMTTTTAAAGQVMMHLDFLRQSHCKHMDVHTISVTEQWAQFAVAGPKSRDLLNKILDTPLGRDQFPFMSCGDVSIAGTSARLFRISFSGEHAYEIAVPTQYGAALFSTLLHHTQSLGGGPYGMEALNVLRIEKGFLTHAEIHGRITMDDIGMDRMVSRKKDCVGFSASRRPGLLGASREQMVGIRTIASDQMLHAGAHLFESDVRARRENDLGYLTSVGYSPTLSSYLGLGFLRNGRARIGDHLRMVDHLHGADVTVEICDPVFFDLSGDRLHD